MKAKPTTATPAGMPDKRIPLGDRKLEQAKQLLQRHFDTRRVL